MGKKKNDLSHLTKESKAILELSDDERIIRIQADKWIGYPVAKKALARLEEHINWPSKQRMPNLLMIGPTNNGKSTIIEKFRRQYPSVEPRKSLNDVRMPIVVFQMPPDPSGTRFYSMLLKSTGAEPRVCRSAELEQAALHRLRSVKARILVIDELHNVLSGKSDVRREFLNTLRFLGNELKMPIVGVGTKDAYLAIRSDDQLENRFQPIPIPRWQEGDDLLSLLASFEAVLPLRRRSELATTEMARYIIARTEGTIGEIAMFLSMAAIEAIRIGEERMSAKVLKNTQYQSPTERRRAFERQLQVG
ncbi:MAG: TniB family NTP-binding protein [Candidatus Obscuribacterales bacterium]|nr:TniB family NTP-binding protein [Candidatus Obscuribacterales bacterium]